MAETVLKAGQPQPKENPCAAGVGSKFGPSIPTGSVKHVLGRSGAGLCGKRRMRVGDKSSKDLWEKGRTSLSSRHFLASPSDEKTNRDTRFKVTNTWIAIDSTRGPVEWFPIVLFLSQGRSRVSMVGMFCCKTRNLGHLSTQPKNGHGPEKFPQVPSDAMEFPPPFPRTIQQGLT